MRTLRPLFQQVVIDSCVENIYKMCRDTKPNRNIIKYESMSINPPSQTSKSTS